MVPCTRVNTSIGLLSGDRHPCSKLYRDVVLVISRIEVLVNIIELELQDFNVILQIDILTRYWALIDCA